MTDRVGQKLGNYHLVRLLGRGGFAEVYLGEHLYLKSQAAIKVLYTRLAEEELEGFLTEARTLVQLRHPHIVQVLDFGVESETPFLVMEYAPSGTLRQRHPKGARLQLSTVMIYVKQVVSALQYAHDMKLIHRDIKPENMLVGRRNEVLLSDFGVAVVAQSSRNLEGQAMAGTMGYMAPEQIKTHPRQASDQYALGIVVYEWLCGERPFRGSVVELAAKHCLTPPPPLREKVPTIPLAVEQVVLTALEKDPSRRFASVSAFATALEQASRVGQPVSGVSAPMTTNIIPVDMLAESYDTGPLPSDEVATPVTVLPLVQSSPQASIADKLVPVRQGISRRKLLVGLGLAGLAVAGGGIAWVALGYPLRGHTDVVEAVAWSPDSKRIASASDDMTVQVWDAGDGGNVFTYRGHSLNVDAVAWSPDGRRIASGGSDKTVQVWDAADGGHVFTYRGHTNVVDMMAWSPDGRRIASASDDTTVKVWDAATGGNVYTYHGHSSPVNTLAWSPDGRRIASGGNDTTVKVWDAATGGNVYTYHGHGNSIVDAVAWSPDSRHIASASKDNTVQVWDAADGGHMFTYRRHTATVLTVAWSPDGRRITSGGRDKTVRVWDASDGQEVSRVAS